MSHTLYLGLLASLYGMGGVFAVLILFYVSTKLLMKIFAKKNNDSKERIAPLNKAA